MIGDEEELSGTMTVDLLFILGFLEFLINFFGLFLVFLYIFFNGFVPWLIDLICIREGRKQIVARWQESSNWTGGEAEMRRFLD